MLDVKFSRIATDITSQISLTLKNLVPDHSLTCGNHILIVSISFLFDKFLGNEVRNSDQWTPPSHHSEISDNGLLYLEKYPIKKIAQVDPLSLAFPILQSSWKSVDFV